MNKALFFFTILFLSGCSLSRLQLLEKAKKNGAAHGMTEKIYHTKNFEIFTLQKITDPKKPLRIYIEGDGRAYVTRYQPALDPTPTSGFLLNLVMQDNAPNLLYIARPCQFVESKNCEEKYWTDQRFSSEAISAIAEVIDNFAAKKIELVGYSGGAMLALHLPQKNILNLRTIAGNLDLEKFVAIHKISTLSTPDIDYNFFAKIPQIHFVGSADEVIPYEIFDAYRKKNPRQNCLKLKIVNGATHNQNWPNDWQKFLAEKPSCS